MALKGRERVEVRERERERKRRRGTHSGGVEERSSVAGDSKRGDDDQIHQMTQEERYHHQEQESRHDTLDSLKREREKVDILSQ